VYRSDISSVLFPLFGRQTTPNINAPWSRNRQLYLRQICLFLRDARAAVPHQLIDVRINYEIIHSL
jgi:hypothetical protein